MSKGSRASSLALAAAAVGTAVAALFLVAGWRRTQRRRGDDDKTTHGGVGGGRVGGGGAEYASAAGGPPLLKLAMDGDLGALRVIVARHLSSLSATAEGGADGDATAATARILALKSLADSTDAAGNSAVHGASFAGQIPTLMYLAEECGADLTAPNGMGCTPLWLAAGYGHAEVLDYLVQRVRMRIEAAFGSEEEEKGGDGKGAGRRIMEELHRMNNSGDTPLIAAASRGHSTCCKILLDSAAEISGDKGVAEMLRLSNKGGDTPIHVAAGCVEGGDEVLQTLLERADGCAARSGGGKEVNEEEKRAEGGGTSILDARNSHGLTPLLIASERNSPAAVRILCDHGVSPLPDSSGASPLSVAAFCGCDAAASELLRRKEGLYRKMLNERGGGGMCSPLWLAARTGNAVMCRMLLEAGADVMAENGGGMAPKAAAVKFGKLEAAKVLSDWEEEVGRKGGRS